MREPTPNAARGVHDRVMELCDRRLAGKVLDAPCGEGALSKRLAEAGLTVEAMDIDADSFIAAGPGINFTKADLNGDLPYASSSFDGVVCVEGIEHVENIHHLLRQFSNVLIPGGKLIITTPNILNIASRIKFFLFGSFRYFNSKIEISDKSLVGHIHPAGFTELAYALSKSGFAVEQVATNTDMMRLRVPRRACAAMFRWINVMCNKAYEPALCSPEILFGDILIIVARKVL